MSSDAPVVCNAGPLMVLAKLNLLHLLKALYGRVYIPRTVYDEVVVEGMRQGYDDARTLYLFLDQMGWPPQDVPVDSLPIALCEAPIDRGERDTLALAETLSGALVLMDETEGRRIARAHGLTVRGSLGILIEAYKQSLIDVDQLRLYMQDISRRHDIWISRTLVERLLYETLGAH